jgi:hypothetical protein
LLNKHHVEFLVVGGYAVAFHGFVRATKDIDILFRNSPDNIQNLIDALSGFGISSKDMDKNIFSEQGKIVRIGSSPMLVKLINAISGLTFDEAWKDKATGTYGSTKISFLSKQNLLKTKKAAGRPQDLRDIEELGGKDD